MANTGEIPQDKACGLVYHQDWLLERDISVREVVSGQHGVNILYQFNAPICSVQIARLTDLYFSGAPVNRMEIPGSGSGLKLPSLDIIEGRAMPVATTIGKNQTDYEYVFVFRLFKGN